jgi:CheY-like chemotaxis protein
MRMPRCVLVVDDDQAIRETLRLVLEDSNYVVLEAPDGQTALRMARESQERMVVLLDLIMPGFDGEQVLSAVAGDDTLATRHVYILMTAAHKRLSPTLRALLEMVTAPIMQKPFDLDTLLNTVAEAGDRL